MKRREIYYELPKQQKGINFVFAFVLNLVWFLVVALQLKEPAYVGFLIVPFVALVEVLWNKINKKQEEKVRKEIDKSTNKHIEEFFDYIEKDKQFVADVLHLDVKLYSNNREEIGRGSVYSQLSQKKHNFFQEL